MSKVNKEGVDWLLIKQWATERIEAHRNSLERPIYSDETSQLRGQIASLRELIAFVEPDVPPVVEEESYGLATNLIESENYG